MDRLLKHNIALQRNFDSVWAIKQALAEDNLHDAIMYWGEMTDSDKRDLWVSPRDGGIFTTGERAYMKSDEMAKARRKYED
jgi:hypothetical protein